jgi:hypothetical protein
METPNTSTKIFNHSPEPWDYGDYEEETCLIVDANNKPVADVRFCNSPCGLANSRLIAYAPELLIWCRKLVQNTTLDSNSIRQVQILIDKAEVNLDSDGTKYPEYTR